MVGIKPCQVSVDFDSETVDFNSSALKMQDVPMLAIWVLPPRSQSALKY